MQFADDVQEILRTHESYRLFFLERRKKGIEDVYVQIIIQKKVQAPAALLLDAITHGALN